MTRLAALSVSSGIAVSAITTIPKAASACLVFAHGAGAGMDHPYIVAVCEGLAAREMATLRYQRRRGREDPMRPRCATKPLRRRWLQHMSGYRSCRCSRVENPLALG
jgi:uncharacterized protein